MGIVEAFYCFVVSVVLTLIFFIFVCWIAERCGTKSQYGDNKSDVDHYAYFKVLRPRFNGICGADIAYFKVNIADDISYIRAETYTIERPVKEGVRFLHSCEFRGVCITEEYYERKYKELTNN